ncbi:MAG TPA: hypothetical protein VFB33_10850 [Candidatus Binataceae bacterium]|nr:hypothetical protein [Candidatus Binataceae bacterium]
MLPQETLAFRRIAAALQESRAPYCVLHGWRDLGNRESTDIDIAVSPGALAVVEDALSRDGWHIIQLINYEIGGYFFVATSSSHERRDLLCIDAITSFRHNGRLYLDADDLLSGIHTHQGLSIAALGTEFGYLLVKKIIKGAFPIHQRVLLTELSSQLEERALRISIRLLGSRLGKEMHEWIKGARWNAVQGNLGRLRRALRRQAARRYPGNRLGYWPGELKRLWGRFRLHTGLAVALLGPDGSGKSALIERMRTDLRAAFRESAVFRLRPDIFGRNSAGVNPHPHGAPSRSASASIVKLALLLVDYIAGYASLVKPRLVRNDLVLFDRYYHDLLADPVRYRLRGLSRLVRLVSGFIPEPDLFLILDAPETIILGRKTELPCETLNALRGVYRDLAQSLGQAVVIDASIDCAGVARAAETIVCDYLHSRYLARRHEWFRQPARADLKSDGALLTRAPEPGVESALRVQ